MKKKITFVYALIFLISLTFCFSGCQTSKKEIYLFQRAILIIRKRLLSKWVPARKRRIGSFICATKRVG